MISGVKVANVQSTNFLVRKLELLSPLSESDKALLESHTASSRLYEARENIIREGDATDFVHLVASGFACRYKILPDGQRSIMAYLIPGDFCNVQVFILKAMDHSIGALSPCRIVEISRAAILELTERPNIARAFWWSTLVDEAILRAWIVNVSLRQAEESMAHLLCELGLRMKAIGLGDNDTYALPVTQTDLSDMLGISLVHTNRMLMSLKDRGLIRTTGRQMVLLDADRLRAISGFDSNYLHLAGGKPATTLVV